MLTQWLKKKKLLKIWLQKMRFEQENKNKINMEYKIKTLNKYLFIYRCFSLRLFFFGATITGSGFNVPMYKSYTTGTNLNQNSQ